MVDELILKWKLQRKLEAIEVGLAQHFLTGLIKLTQPSLSEANNFVSALEAGDI